MTAALPPPGVASRPVRAVLIDAMGTLLELLPPAPRLRTELRARFGIELAEGEAQAAIDAEIAYYRAHHCEGHDRAALARLRRRCAAALRAGLPEGTALPSPGALTPVLLRAIALRAQPDAPHALEALREIGVRTVAVSNWDVSLHDALADAGLDRYLTGVITSAELGVAKPDPAIFRHALTLAGVPAGAAVHVGDRLDEDVAGARAAGIEPVLLRRDGSRAAGMHTIADLGELVELVGAPA